MKRMHKSKKGFTLIEMIIVIAIIVILAAAMIIGLTQYLDTADDVAVIVSAHESEIGSVDDRAQGHIDAITGGGT